jgi:hypothetical protein
MAAEATIMRKTIKKKIAGEIPVIRVIKLSPFQIFYPLKPPVYRKGIIVNALNKS